MVPPDRPLPRPLESGAVPDDPPQLGAALRDPSETPPQGGRFSFVVSVLLIALAFSIGLSYLLEKQWLSRSAAAPAAAALGPAEPEAPGEGPSAILPLTAEMLHATAGSPGPNPFVIVNGQKIGEGESAKVPTSSGPITVRVEKIEEGVVHFIYGSERIAVKVNPAVVQGNPP